MEDFLRSNIASQLCKMKKIAGRSLIFLLLGAWALFAISSGHRNSHKCNDEWKNAFPYYSSKPPKQNNDRVGIETITIENDISATSIFSQ
jgi:hypothetical protein